MRKKEKNKVKIQIKQIKQKPSHTNHKCCINCLVRKSCSEACDEWFRLEKLEFKRFLEKSRLKRKNFDVGFKIK